MKKYDVIVIGSGAGMNIASGAYQRGMKVAVVEHGPMGGTCLNRGCIPTKILTYVADLIVQTEHMKELNVTVKIESIDFPALMDRMRHEVQGDSKMQGDSVDAAEGLDWYKETGEFTKDYTLRVGDEEITAPNIFVASGMRPFIPKIEGLEDIGYLDSKTALDLTSKPKSMIILGGGYIATEYGHFFSAVGVDVTILGRNQYLVKGEDHDVSELLKQELSKRMGVHTNHEVVRVFERDGMKVVVAKDRATGEEKEFEAEVILTAAGRIPNSDLLKPEKSGVKVDDKGFVVVDEFLRTNKKGIWAFGDAVGRYQFRHVANDESQIAWYNFLITQQHKGSDEPDLYEMDYHAVPWAVFSYPPIATVGMTLRQAKESGIKLMVGEAYYNVAAKGMAMGNPPSLIRVIADADTKRLIGATIIGPYAPILIQEIVNLMYTHDGSYYPLMQAMHIHPALPEVVQRAVGRLKPLDGGHEHHH
ncbi:MAG: dihydrolipoyl dehydrogenase [Candidatus Thorarchaeota archaeon]